MQYVLSPGTFAFLSDGSLAVSDWEAYTIWEFDDSLSFKGNMGQFFPGSPSGIEPGVNGSIIGVGLVLEASDSGIEGESFVARWSNSTEEDVRYLSRPILVVQDGDMIHIQYAELAYAVDPAGNIYIAESSDSTYCIWAYRSDGEQYLTIEESWTRIPRTESEIACQREYLEQKGIDAEPGLYRSSIAELLTDNDGNLWVRLGSELHPSFIVYTSEGDTLFTADSPALPDTLFNLRFAKGINGLLAWDTDPLDYPKVIMLEVMQE